MEDYVEAEGRGYVEGYGVGVRVGRKMLLFVFTIFGFLGRSRKGTRLLGLYTRVESRTLFICRRRMSRWLVGA